VSAPRLLVLGAGFAGLEAARTLADHREAGALPPETAIHLVDRAEDLTVPFWLHQVAAGSRRLDQARLPLAEWALPGIERHHGEVRDLDPHGQRLAVAGETLHYDQAVIALGGTAHLPAIPGLADHAYTVRTPEAAAGLHTALEQRLQRAAGSADPGERRRLLRVVVAGGGYTGCQLAGELAQQWPQRAAGHGLPPEETEIVLLEAGSGLLPGQPAFQGGYAEGALARLGVTVRTEAPVAGVSADAVSLATEAVPCGLLAWTGGLAGPRPALDGLPAGDGGRIAVSQQLQVAGFSHLWAAGDAALPAGAPPATAHEAVAQGRTAAANMAASVNGRPLHRHHPSRRGLVVSLGPDDAVGQAGPLGIAGRPAACLKRGAERALLDTIRDRPR
jgi:NADH dehydrogenase